MQNPTKDSMKSVLEEANTIAVVGLSDNTARTSYMIAKEMQTLGYKIIPVNPKVKEVLGETSYPSLKEVPHSIDIVNVFRRSEYLPEIAKETLETDAKTFWAQLGVSNDEAYEILKEKEINVIMDACIKVVHQMTIGK
ncbi:CoA-binding protein [Halalkalibacillus halophilus]|uniref:CoA-binding protein n=1 Tax=Halalkalibacillus halophilus TaxID=392827 RepID=UPI0003F65428|nr:CoA-binding protein [Halalkalibacillus halophilus]